MKDDPITVRPAAKNQARVLVVDNDPVYSEIFMNLLRLWGFTAIQAQGFGDALVEDALQKARRFRCQLALVDMRLHFDQDTEDFRGLDLAPRLKPAETIIVSGFGDHKTATRSIREKGAFSFVGKEDGPEALKEALEAAACKYCYAWRGIQIGPPETLAQVSRRLLFDVPEAQADEVQDVLARLFPQAQALEIEGLNSPTEIQTPIQPVTLSAVPRPNSVILKVNEDGRQPVLVKLARSARITQEIENYQAHIRGQLVGNYLPVLINQATLWDLGGAVYSYLGTNNITTFTDHYLNAPTERVQASLEKFFGGVWSRLYHTTQVERFYSVFQAYCKVWEHRWYQKVLSMQPTAPPGQGMEADLWRSLQAPDPVAWLVERLGQEPPQQAQPFMSQVLFGVTHGDLHGDNLLIDDREDAWVVDFERSGDGPILQDFVELESDIVNRLTYMGDDFGLFYRLCLWIASPEQLQPIEAPAADPELLKPIQVISSIRDLAQRLTGVSDAYQYLLGLLFNTLFRASILHAPHKLTSRQRALMLASILCHRLDHWGQPWPPPEWPPAKTVLASPGQSAA